MNTVTTGRKVTLKKSFLTMVDKRMAKFDKYFDDAEATVTITVEGNRQTAEITVKSRGFMFRAERTGLDMESSFSDAADLIDKQIIKNKSKLGSRIKKVATETPMQDFDGYEDMADSEYRVAREKRFLLKPMSTEEAILQMNMLGHSFFVFMNIDTSGVCVVYRRNDDDYGLLMPEY